MEKLTIIENGKDKVVEFGDDVTSITIGRAPENDVQITEKRSSRQHVRIDREEDGTYRLVDLGSSNGTRIGGEKVHDQPIVAGTKFEIGEAVLIFGEAVAAPAPVKTERPKTSRREKTDKTKTTGAARRGKRTTSRRSREEDEKRTTRTGQVARGGVVGQLVADLKDSIEREVPREYRPYLAAGLGLFVAIPVLFLLVYGINQLTKTDDSHVVHALYEKGRDEMEKGDEELDSARRLSVMQGTAAGADAESEIQKHFARMESHYASAAKSFEGVVARDQAPDLTQKAQESINRMDRVLAHNRQAIEELHRIKQRVRVAGLTPTQYLTELEALENYYRETVVLGEIRRQRTLAQREQAKEIEKEFDSIEEAASAEIESGNYHDAIEVWKRFAGRYNNPELDSKVEDRLREIDRRAESDYDRLRRMADSLADQKRFDEARAIYSRAMNQFRGTSVPFRAQEGLSLLELMVREGVDRERGLAMMAKQSKFREKAHEADALARQNRYEAAMSLFNEVIAEIERTGDRELTMLARRYEARIAELQRIVALIEKLKNALINRSLDDWSFSDREGLVHTIDSADDEVVNYSFHGGAATVPKEWTSHDALDMLYLFGLLRLTAEDRFALAIFCFDNQLLPEGQAELVGILREDRTQEREIFEFYARKTGQAVPEGGFVVHDNRLMTVDERDRYEDTKELDRLTRGRKYPDLMAALDRAERKYGAEFVAERKAEISNTLREEKDKLLTRLKNETSRGDIGQLRQLRTELDKRREHALELIFDEQKYPYDACHGCEAQPEVDKRVDSVKEVWERPADAVKAVSSDVARATDRINEINGLLTKIDPGHKDDTGGLDLEYIKSLANKQLDIKNFADNSGDMKKVGDSNQIMDDNESKQTVATDLEREQVRITNEYRVMMGKHALRLDDSLVKAARGHSQFMASSGQFAHNIPGHPNGASPMDRARKEGYNGAVGENISMGRPTPQGAHEAWLHSSGHHRNILRDEIGRAHV